MDPYPHPYSQAAKLDPRIKDPRPPIEPSLAPLIDSCQLPEDLSLDLLRGTGQDEIFVYTADKVLQSAPTLKHTEYSTPERHGISVLLSVFSPKEPTSQALPALYHIHGGGMVAGDRFTALPELVSLLKGIECVVVSVEYRLAPETRAPRAAEDCYAGLAWTWEHAGELGVDPSRIVVWGVSGGAALATAVCLMARDAQRRGGDGGDSDAPMPFVKAQMLVTPMLDDRCDTVSEAV
ncbi:Alpha/Beta hydrolase protein [Emericellopsis atlantica]|uniref:Alpha/Beta hydrolase protein n=1 Tax=Emericellopsis atlantica TaxID=2614577 RepID=A0A9P8CPU0_9HYPO|nr:Alpha/Beta hydrolase protein [Emericellopsis atlantica]KAG9254547.1 Alpha/Beta hydrolase protein [Emericellopsis atlantica]